MRPWFKRDCGLALGSRVRQLGKGRKAARFLLLWEEIIAVATEEMRDGRVFERDVDPELLAFRLGWWGFSKAECKAGLQRIIEVGLLVKRGNAYELNGWDYYRPGDRYLSKAQRATRDRGSSHTTSHADAWSIDHPRVEIEEKNLESRSKRSTHVDDEVDAEEDPLGPARAHLAQSERIAKILASHGLFNGQPSTAILDFASEAIQLGWTIDQVHALVKRAPGPSRAGYIRRALEREPYGESG